MTIQSVKGNLSIIRSGKRVAIVAPLTEVSPGDIIVLEGYEAEYTLNKPTISLGVFNYIFDTRADLVKENDTLELVNSNPTNNYVP